MSTASDVPFGARLLGQDAHAAGQSCEPGPDRAGGRPHRRRQRVKVSRPRVITRRDRLLPTGWSGARRGTVEAAEDS